MMVHIFAKIQLDKDKYHLLRNVTLPTANGTTQIDQIIISEYGVFVIETKNMKGWIFGSVKQKTWTQKIFKYTKKFQNPLHQNYKHVKTLKSLLALTDQQIFSVVVFVGSSTFKTKMPDNVIKGPGLMKYIKSKKQQVILSADVPMILSKIDADRLLPSRQTTKAHVEHVKEIVEEKQNGNNCPKCGSYMVVRTVNRGASCGEKFLGCSRFPECRGTAAMPAEDEVVEIGTEEETVFSDSWGNKTWRDDDIQPALMDRAFR
ncbi:DNA-binding protein [Desulfosarcina alkanivorans]|uniref:DNA-binding protein n=2 Tax=Desulfosarcina alkanivorans TaxID=571177 RepID=A0A5K7YNA2_9BACT|nr:DNA-binding protein [Desulfosarcina alkanivorans]